MRIIGLTKDGHVGQQLKQLLSENWLVALVADRDLTGRGIEVEMFGETRRVPAGPALLSLSSGAPLVVCPVYTRDDGWEVRIGEPLEFERTGVMREDVAALSRLMAERFERAIAAKPTDWHMFQPAWPQAAFDGRRAGDAGRTPVKILLVCPYDWDAPGGVQVHVRQLADELGSRGHRTTILAPGSRPSEDAGVRDRGAAGPRPVPRHGRADLVLAGVVATDPVRDALVRPRRDPRARAAHAEHLDARGPGRERARRRHVPRVPRSFAPDGARRAGAASGERADRRRGRGLGGGGGVPAARRGRPARDRPERRRRPRVRAPGPARRGPPGRPEDPVGEPAGPAEGVRGHAARVRGARRRDPGRAPARRGRRARSRPAAFAAERTAEPRSCVSGPSRTPSFPGTTRRPTSPCRPRPDRRASGSCSSRRWRPACRSSRRTSRATGRWSATASTGSWSRRTTPNALAAAIRRVLSEPELAATPGGRGADARGDVLLAGRRAPPGGRLRPGHRRDALGCRRAHLAVDRRHPGRPAAARRHLDLQPARHAPRPRRQRLVADRRPAAPALRPDPEPRRDRQGLRDPRARGVRARHRGADPRDGRDARPGPGAGREPDHPAGSGSCSRWPRTTPT